MFCDKRQGSRPSRATEQRLELLQFRGHYIGGEVTVRFNGRTPDGVPRFPRAVAWFPGGERDV